MKLKYISQRGRECQPRKRLSTIQRKIYLILVFDSNIPVVSMSNLQDLQFCNLYYEKQLNQVYTDKLETLQCAFHGSSAYNREGDTSNCTLWWLQQNIITTFFYV